ncbi:MAG: helix-turn-helix domain-containing protein [Coriobacteriia bacterium]|nr:helix-turn-helix domain-containing protein [Coriobacteriia bacterium]MDO5328533.1 helix-turn-helix domain-containing protein [Coriobacteriia bacterium]
MKINNSKDFGKAIAQARKSRNLTQQDLADYTGYSVSYISHLENGKASAEIDKAIRLANLLALDINITSRNETL